jgi:death on curing protein
MRHLSLSEVRIIHSLLLEQYGGLNGERDLPALEGALAQPSAEYFGVPLHPTPADQAAAYWFHLCQAHAFLDGNKRTATFSMLAFLQMNGLTLNASDTELFDLVLQIAQGQIEKSELAVWLESRVRLSP